MSEHIRKREQENSNELWRALPAWFLGPKAENREEFNRLVLSALNHYEDVRASYQPVDPPYITDDVKHSRIFQHEIQNLEDCLRQLNTALKDSVPFFSTRYKGHMVWDTTLPSMVGYISGLLWNQNNVDSSTSPVTTTIEITVAKELCCMLGFSKNGDTEPWGHLTGCGSLANIEALWAARNLKLYPIALKNAVMKDQRLCLANTTATVNVPRLGYPIRLVDAETWDLLNLDIDEVCRLAATVANAANVSMQTLSSILDDYTQTSLGMVRFLNANKINCPVFFSPATNHYSWPKAATLLGLGYDSLIQVPVKSDGRQDLAELEKSLEHCLEEKIPVLALVAIIGTTEESAVDPVSHIVAIREKFRKKGLTFSIHADAAWGGYLKTMLLEPTGERAQKFLKREVDHESVNRSSRLLRRTQSIPTRLSLDPLYIQSLQDVSFTKQMKSTSPKSNNNQFDSADFVPTLPLSRYVADQYMALRYVDTITIDPHKAGYCVYPSGALCYRNGSMRGFITLAAPEVYHGENDPSVGVYGIEGSKPGAAATSVFLSHKVIGLDKFGYGRILGQCNFAAKLFYCMWQTVAKESDPFICVNFIESKSRTVIDAKAFIIKNILGKSDKEIFYNDAAMEFLAEIGPDALINTFVVNLKNDDGTINTNIDVANALQTDIFKELSGCVGLSPKRIPMFLTTSHFNSKKYGKALDDFKRRLGLADQEHERKDLKFLRSTIMNPFQSSNVFVQKMATIFRNTVLNCVAKIKEKPIIHEFIGTHINKEGFLYAVNIPSFEVPEKSYQTILKMRVADSQKLVRLRQAQRTNDIKCLTLRTVDERKMHYVVRSHEAQSFNLYYEGSGCDLEMGMSNVDLVVEDVIKFDHFEPVSSDVSYPLCQKYFLFGNNHEAFITHVITKAPDFFQVIRLDTLPHSVPTNVLDLGVDVTILGISGSPLIHSGEIQDPLQADKYSIKLRCTNSIEIKSEISLHESSAKLCFKGLK